MFLLLLLIFDINTKIPTINTNIIVRQIFITFFKTAHPNQQVRILYLLLYIFLIPYNEMSEYLTRKI